MNYEIVDISEKMVSGVKIRTNNSASDVAEKIGGLWNDFYEKGINNSIENKVTGKCLGMYGNYESDAMGDYDFLIGSEVSKASENMETVIIPSGKYAKFVVKGHVQKAVIDCWMKIWSMELDRRYNWDFEEYQEGEDMDNMEIHIYVSIN